MHSTLPVDAHFYYQASHHCMLQPV
jgi:hypothetical protein